MVIFHPLNDMNRDDAWEDSSSIKHRSPKHRKKAAKHSVLSNCA
jgi:hypothetical protein